VGIYYAEYKLPTSGWLLYALPVGFISAIILTICHELMHSKYRFEKILARIVASFSFWGLHEFEHLFFHHNNEVICTDSDKSYARLNQSLYSFLFQAYIGNYQHAWRIQKQISKRNDKSFYNIFDNLLLQIYLCSLVILLITFLLTGIYGTLFLLIQGIIGFILFLAGTYNQHYGLTRRKNNGTYEPFTFMNVWSSDFYISSKLYFNVTHHAHHHKHQFCHYEFLEIINKNPILPYNYNTMVFLSFIPPLWYKIMNRRVEIVLENRDKYSKDGLMM
jgi:alkane 1-monooxygenase